MREIGLRWIGCLVFCAVFCLVLAVGFGGSEAKPPRPSFPWRSAPKVTEVSLQRRFVPPQGYRRTPLPRDSFGGWLRRLPLLPKGSPVMYFDGRRKPEQHHHAAVVDLDIGKRDLQQCADAIMRLWGEYLWSQGREKEMDFHFLSGQRNPWLWWSRGDRIRLEAGGRRIRWLRRQKEADRSYQNYRRYLDFVMTWANTSSLLRQLQRVSRKEIQAGDILLQGWRGGRPGHAVLILDQVERAGGERLYLLGQSYMPAQSFHILNAPKQKTSPWYRFPSKGEILTPEWRFSTRDFFRLPSSTKKD